MVLKCLGDYEDQTYVIQARAEDNATYRLYARPVDEGVWLATKPLKSQAFTKTLRALRRTESDISGIRKILESGSTAEIGGAREPIAFDGEVLAEAGFEPVSSGSRRYASTRFVAKMQARAAWNQAGRKPASL